MALLRIKAPAKINLFLEILNRRADGYHELRTVMHTLDWADTLSFNFNRHGLRVTCDHPLVPTDESNLVTRAARALAQCLGCQPNIHIHIHKSIPVAAGLGGGSSNAAAALRGLAVLWGRPDPACFRRLARNLGSDVPFFIQGGGCALGWGRGERISHWPEVTGLRVAVINPGFPVSTAEIYKKTRLGLTRKNSCINMMRQAIAEKNLIKIGQNIFNRLEDTTIRLHPIVKQMKDDLLACGASAALMSGSGPTVFGLVPSPQVAHTITAALGRRYPVVHITRTRGRDRDEE